MQATIKTLADMKSESTVFSESIATIYPQPAREVLVVNANFAVKDYSVRTFIGKTSIDKDVKGQSLFSIDTSSLPTGVHILTLIGIQNEQYETLFAKN